MPMFFVPGEMGVLFKQISAVVVAVLLVSLLEALFILTAHLVKTHQEKAWITRISLPQKVVNTHLNNFIDGSFRKFLRNSLQQPAILITAAISALLITIGAILGGLLEFSFTPTIASDTVIAQATLPYGTPRDQAAEIQRRLVNMGQKVLQENGMTSPGIFSCIGARLDEGEVETESLGGFHYVSVLLALPPTGERNISGYAFAQTWRDAFGDPIGLEAISFTGEKNMTGGEPVRLDVSHRDLSIARSAAIALGNGMQKCSGLTSVDDGIRVGKPELRFKLKDNGVHMGLTTDAMARQVRHCFYGAEALSFVREGNEIRVMVRLNEGERKQRESVENMLLRTPEGALVPLSEVAEIIEGQSFTRLARRDGRRVFPVTADIRAGVSDNKIESILEEEVIPAVEAAFPGISIRFGGEEAEVDEALSALGSGFMIALGIMFFLISLRFNSYRQPLMLLSVIPFSFVGAIWGHIVLGYNLSIVSIIGMIAMAGVVVNNSIVLVDAYNRYRANNDIRDEVIVKAACRRFRPILMTTLTTFFGLAPLMIETSEQAQFLIPAAISIGFGLLFGTLITLTIVPVMLHWVEK
jgi:multidrug efflux pump subunit AcrB